MKVLWFSGSQCSYPKGYRGYNGGGWIDSIEKEIKNIPEIELGVCFPMKGQPFKTIIDSVTYYPICPHNKNLKQKIYDAIKFNDIKRDKAVWSQYICQAEKIIEDFNPDVIEIFGSETYIQLAAMATNKVPKILHIQGLLSPSTYIYYPNGISHITNYFQDWNPVGIYKRFQYDVIWKRNCYREQQIIKNVNHIIGRTNWDKAGVSILNPNAKYYYGGEILRPVFYEQIERHIPEKLTIVTTSSKAMYKGYDFVLKVADILKNRMNIDFEWKVYGNVHPKFFENATGIKHQNVNVNLCGVASAEQLHDALISSSMYFQPSHIENSPNSVCEAQIMGIPPIATNVGGTSSLIKDGETGILVPAGEPYYAAYQISKLFYNKDLNILIGNNAKKIARNRHDKSKIVKELLQTYHDVIVDK